MWEPLCSVAPAGITLTHFNGLATEEDEPGSQRRLCTIYLENTVRSKSVNKKTSVDGSNLILWCIGKFHMCR